MHLKNVKIIDSFNLTGRGKVMVTDLSYDENCCNFSKGDTFRFEDKIYEIISSEAILSIDRTENVALIVKEISNKQLFSKLVSDRKSTWMEDAKWRKKNRWWLGPWKRIQIKWYCVIKPFFEKTFKK